MMGGAITFASKTYSIADKPGIAHASVTYAAMAVALAVLGWCACTWIKENMKLENLAREQVINRLKSQGITDEIIPNPKTAVNFGYEAVLATATIMAIVVVGAPVISGLWAIGVLH